MNSLVRAFSNFKEFYSDINAATLTGAIDVIVVEQPDGEFQCSPFHVRFGKLGVLRSREKVVDIEINGEPVDIHMKLGESGEAFFVEECPEEDVEELPDNLATSPIPTGFFPTKFTDEPIGKDKTASDDIQLPLPLPLPRRNSIDFSKEAAKEEALPKFENQISDFSHRRYTDNVLERRNLSDKLKEYTTQKIRQEWAEHEEIFQFDAIEKDKDWSNSTQAEEKPLPEDTAPTASSSDATLETRLQSSTTTTTITTTSPTDEGEENTKEPTIIATTTPTSIDPNSNNNNSIKEESKSKKKRRKKSQMKKKNAQRKSSSSSSIGSNAAQESALGAAEDGADVHSISISNNTNNSSSNDEATPKSGDQLVTARSDIPLLSEELASLPAVAGAARIHDPEIHFFSDTEVTGAPNSTANTRGAGRDSTAIQSDSELEVCLHDKVAEVKLITSSASWKWGELPTPDGESKDVTGGEAERASMLSSMFNFMKKSNSIRKQNKNVAGMYLSDLDAEGIDPEMAAKYIHTSAAVAVPRKSKEAFSQAGGGSGDEDRESGNGTSIPHSPCSMEGQKSLDSDYEEKIMGENSLDFMAMSLCGVNENGDPLTDEFDNNLVNYSDNAIEHLMANAKQDAAAPDGTDAYAGGKGEVDGTAASGAAAQSKRSWWYWRRGQATGVPNQKLVKTGDEKDADQMAVATQTSRPNTPDVSENSLSKTDSTLNAENTSALVENLEDLSQVSSNSENSANDNKNERFKKSLRLSSEAIKKLNLKDGMNEVEFSVTTAYQGTSRCKCYLFRWKHNDKVVISDIDGTITRSDVLGHLLPMVGKDWAQLGVAQLFSKIEQNGYKVLYLSARAIGQSRLTREYLRSIRQGDVKLPDGPLLLNPTSLISAFHREVIERKPEQFKIACLTDIRDLFPNKDPFYAGYGNRINDVWAYRAVGIPIMRIFTINTKGELKHELTQTFQSSGYINQSLEVDEHFPPLELNDYEYQTDMFEDDEEENELKFSETDDDGDDGEDDNELFSDEYVDDGIGIDDDEGLLISSGFTGGKTEVVETQRRILNAAAGGGT